MKSRNALYFLFLAVVVAGLVVFLVVRQDKQEMDMPEVEAKTPSNQHPESISASPEEVRLIARTKEPKIKKLRLSTRIIDRKKRAEVLALILTALQEKERRTEEKYSKESLKPTGLPAEYIREAVKEVRPLLKECYHMELEERGIISGRLVFEFEIIADDEHGGLVQEAKIAETELSKEISDSFAECLRETIYSLRFDPAMQAGRHTVRYPVIFNAVSRDD